MENASATITRLLHALEALANEDKLLLQQHQYPEAQSVRQRELPLVTRLADLLKDPAHSAALTTEQRTRARCVLAIFQSTLDSLSGAKNQIRTQLRELQTAQAKTKRLRPAYGQPLLTPAFHHEA